MSHSGFLHSFYSFLLSCLRVVIMGAEEMDLTLETMSSTLMEEKAHHLGEKFGFMIEVRLEVAGEDK